MKRKFEFFVSLLLVVMLTANPLVIYASELYVNEYDGGSAYEDAAFYTEMADVPDDVYEPAFDNEADAYNTAAEETPDPVEQSDDFIAENEEIIIEEIPADEVSEDISIEDDDSEDAAAESAVSIDESDVYDDSLSDGQLTEELTGASAYSFQVVWLDSGARPFDLGACKNLTQAQAKANSIMKSIGLANRYTLKTVGNTITATVKKPAEINSGGISIIAHMGYIRYAPENTVSAIRMAAAYGFKEVEFDVRFTKDGVPVLQHDSTINQHGRNADGSSIDNRTYISNLTYDELLQYDFGIHRGSVWKGEKITTLDEALSACAKSGLKANIDMKNWMNAKTSESIYSLVDKYGLKGRVNYLSSDTYSLKLFIQQDPDADYTLIVSNLDSDYIKNAQVLDQMVSSRVHLFIQAKYITEKVARTCRFNCIPLDTTVTSTTELLNLDRWVKRINTTTLTPTTVLQNEYKRKAYSVKSFSGDVLTGKDYGLYASMDCGLCVHMISSTPNRAVVLGDTDSLAEMNDFRFERLENGRYQILSTRCMLALTPDADGKIVLRNPDDHDAEQQWDLLQNSNRTYTLMNAAHAQTLHWESAIESAALVLADPDGSDNEQFFLALAAKQVNVQYSGKLYRFMSAAGSGYSIGIWGGSIQEGSNAIITKTNTAFRAQKFSLIYSGDGYYRIVNDYSNKCLEIKNGVVVQTDWKNRNQQRWKIVSRKEGGCTLECKSGGIACIQGSALSYGRLIGRANSYNGSKYQRWTMKIT